MVSVFYFWGKNYIYIGLSVLKDSKLTKVAFLQELDNLYTNQS